MNCTGITQSEIKGSPSSTTTWMNVLSLKKLGDSYHESELGCKVTFSTEDNSAVVSDPEKPAEVFVLKVCTTIS